MENRICDLSEANTQFCLADVDECGTELARCSSNTYCFNTDGSYECRGTGGVVGRMCAIKCISEILD